MQSKQKNHSKLQIIVVVERKPQVPMASLEGLEIQGSGLAPKDGHKYTVFFILLDQIEAWTWDTSYFEVPEPIKKIIKRVSTLRSQASKNIRQVIEVYIVITIAT